MRHANISIFIPHLGCPHACSFCNQKTISGTVNPPSAENVRKALADAYSQINEADRPLTEIAFFGGSFTAINREYMISLLEAAAEFIDTDNQSKFHGIRISTRPDCIDEEILMLLKKYHVTAIELGAQSMCDRVLEMNERGHTSQDVIDSSMLIKSYGFELGLQMMTGLYGSTENDEFETMKKIIEIHPDTARIYPIAVLRNTRLAELFECGKYQLYPFEKAVEICAEIYRSFISNNIRVIRMGLHAEDGIENNVVAGFYHPAFAEIVRSYMFGCAIKRHTLSDSGNVQIIVSPSDVSCTAGHKKSNKEYFAAHNQHLQIKQDKNIPQGSFMYNGKIYSIFEN